MATPFTYDLGVSQGRVHPANALPTDGNYVFVLGSDRTPAPEFVVDVGERVEVSQVMDLTSVRYVRAAWRVRQPVTPLKLTLPAGTALRRGGVLALDPALTAGADPRHAYRIVGAGAGAVTYWALTAGATGTSIRVAHVVPAASWPATDVRVAGQDIEARLRSDAGSLPLATAQEVTTAVNQNAEAQRLVYAGAAANGVVSTAALAALTLADDALNAVVTLADFFTVDMQHRIVRVSGAVNPGNNGDKRLLGAWPRVGILADAVVSEDPVTAIMPGARWRAAIYVDGVERAAVTEYRGRDVQRSDLAAHVSKLSGNRTVSFRLSLVESD